PADWLRGSVPSPMVRQNHRPVSRVADENHLRAPASRSGCASRPAPAVEVRSDPGISSAAQRASGGRARLRFTGASGTLQRRAASESRGRGSLFDHARAGDSEDTRAFAGNGKRTFVNAEG